MVKKISELEQIHYQMIKLGELKTQAMVESLCYFL